MQIPATIASGIQRGESPQPQPQPQTRDPGALLCGQWLSDASIGNARLTITSFPGTQLYSLHLVTRGQGVIVATFKVVSGKLAMLYANGSRGEVGYRLSGGQLTLLFPGMPPISFTRGAPPG